MKSYEERNRAAWRWLGWAALIPLGFFVGAWIGWKIYRVDGANAGSIIAACITYYLVRKKLPQLPADAK